MAESNHVGLLLFLPCDMSKDRLKSMCLEIIICLTLLQIYDPLAYSWVNNSIRVYNSLKIVSRIGLLPLLLRTISPSNTLFFIGNSIFHLSLELLTKFWKTSLLLYIEVHGGITGTHQLQFSSHHAAQIQGYLPVQFLPVLAGLK